MAGFPNVFEALFTDAYDKDHPMKGAWNRLFFGNDAPIVLELGCGKGEYTCGLARKFPGKNFIGVDIKGARMWVGARDALQHSLRNVAFLRTRIEWIASSFAPGEVSELWITFPDPQPRSPRISKRLTSARFLQQYRSLLCPQGLVHLKTDSTLLFEYTRELLEYNGLEILEETSDLYAQDREDEILSIRTHYETLFMGRGETIKYLRFRIEREGVIEELPKTDEEPSE
jgi:tRNA (guanine-N7-)-methyltransferase